MVLDIMDIFMHDAIEEALKGLKEGGVPIGAVLVGPSERFMHLFAQKL
jgi:tRNA(Arg) A34 adenosine deaminase TadA